MMMVIILGKSFRGWTQCAVDYFDFLRALYGTIRHAPVDGAVCSSGRANERKNIEEVDEMHGANILTLNFLEFTNLTIY